MAKLKKITKKYKKTNTIYINYFNNHHFAHKLNGPSSIVIDNNLNNRESYYINGHLYMFFSDGVLQICPFIFNIQNKYFKYIKKNIINLIKIYNPIITLSLIYDFTKEEINNLPDFIKDFIIL